MNTFKVLLAVIYFALSCFMAGCGRKEAVSPGDSLPKSDLPKSDSSVKCDIQAAIEEIPKRLDCRQWRETDWFVYSNICCAVRQIDDKEKRSFYSIAYTNEVLKLMPTSVSIRTDDQLDKWRVRIENYVALVRWGGGLLDENAPLDVSTWDFLLGPPVLIRREIDAHKKALMSKDNDLARVERDYHVRMLKDLMDNCQREIVVCWYEGAKRKMSARQLEDIRRKIKGAFGKLPSEIEKEVPR